MTIENYNTKSRKIDCQNGTIYHFTGNVYKVCGIDRNGKRFRIVTLTPHHALGINLWHGRKYVRYADEKKFRMFDNVI